MTEQHNTVAAAGDERRGYGIAFAVMTAPFFIWGFVTALNDYHTELPMEDFYAFPVLLAYSLNGELMSVRDKGPLWIVFPRDDNPVFGEPENTYKWVWQLATMEVR